MNELSCKQMVRSWIKAETEGQTEIDLPDLCNEATKIFVQNPEFMEAFAQEFLKNTIYTLAIQMFMQDRQMIILGDKALDKEGVTKKARENKVFRSWLTWPEHIGHVYKTLSECTNADLLVAAAERERRGRHEMKFAALWRKVATTLSDTETVGQRYSDGDLQKLFSEIEIEPPAAIPVPGRRSRLA